MAEKIGFVGLGIMGKPMAQNLLKAGYSLTVYDIVGQSMEDVVTDGATGASSNKEVADATDKIITMLPDSADSEAAILGPNSGIGRRQARFSCHRHEFDRSLGVSKNRRRVREERRGNVGRTGKRR